MSKKQTYSRENLLPFISSWGFLQGWVGYDSPIFPLRANTYLCWTFRCDSVVITAVEVFRLPAHTSDPQAFAEPPSQSESVAATFSFALGDL